MLVEFSVGNFRSFNERQTFSMAADVPHKEPRRIIDTGFNAALRLLEAAAIFGANGSGKSNLVRAMEFAREFVINSSKNTQQGEEIDAEPFAFAPPADGSASEFEFVFIHADWLFQYGFSLTRKKVCKEWLYATPKDGKRQTPQRWFERDENDVTNSYVKKELKGAKKLWLQSTRDNALFLSTAAQLDAEDFAVPFGWITKHLKTLVGNWRFHPGATIAMLENPATHEKIIDFMKKMGGSFHDIKTVKRKISTKDVKGFPEEIKNKLKNEDFIADIFCTIYTIDDMEYMLDLGEESDGTIRLLEYAAPILTVLENGETLIAYELHNHLHPLALRRVLEMFQCPKQNPHGAQLAFTTHEPSVMDHMDRDQIWLAEKNRKMATVLQSVADFEGRAGEAVAKRYLSGRYGAVPFIRESAHG